MSATPPATEPCRQINIAERITAQYDAERGRLEYQYRNRAGFFILASSWWEVQPEMTDDGIRGFFAENQDCIWLDFNTALQMRGF